MDSDGGCMIGTTINSLAIIMGCMIGLILKGHFPERISVILFQGIGLVTFMIGIQMAIQGSEVLLIILSLVLLEKLSILKRDWID